MDSTPSLFMSLLAVSNVSYIHAYMHLTRGFSSEPISLIVFHIWMLNCNDQIPVACHPWNHWVWWWHKHAQD
uniref:Uncharacterized protein n=1 Tax=Anguilla anguilla TaxID=7936 RepID=A0A0E9PHS6_ANGAN